MTKEQFIEIYGQKCYDDSLTITYNIDTSYDTKNYLPPTHGCNIYNEDGTLKDEYLPTENVWSNENLIQYLRRL